MSDERKARANTAEAELARLRETVERLHEQLLEVYGRAFLCRPPTASTDSLAELLDEFNAALSPAPQRPATAEESGGEGA